jgi:hypothetical protein
MSSLAPHMEAFLREHLVRHRGASQHTCDSYAYSFQSLFEFAAKKLKVAPSARSCASETPKSAAVCSKSWVSVRADSSSAGDFGTFKERLRSLTVEEIGQAGEGLPRVGGWFGPAGSGRFSASGGVHTP